uniref:Uncharacterized protein n=1 Tax=Anguilla anguilla TaxID=7936 RepID=A0A0E9S4Z6_ANGAN
MGEGALDPRLFPPVSILPAFHHFGKGLVWSHLSRKTLANSNLAFQFLQYFHTGPLETAH